MKLNQAGNSHTGETPVMTCKKYMTDEYYAALSKGNKVIKAEWFDSLIEAKKWAETCEEENYTVSIFKGSSDKPLLKYDKRGLF